MAGFTSASNMFGQCADSANIYSFTYQGKKYEIVKEMKPWAQAAYCAKQRGGHLVEINDSAEQVAVFNAITQGANVSATYTSVSNGGGVAYVWIGATDQKTEGTWIWDGDNDNSGTEFYKGQGNAGGGNGKAVNGLFNNWGGKSSGTNMEPDDFGSSQDHAGIGLEGWPKGNPMLGKTGEWNDIPGSSNLYYVIEYPLSSGLQLSPQNEEGLFIYPNPAQSHIQIMGLQPFDNIRVYSNTGSLIWTGNTPQISTEGWASGLYWICAENTSCEPRTTRFVIP